MEIAHEISGRMMEVMQPFVVLVVLLIAVSIIGWWRS